MSRTQIFALIAAIVLLVFAALYYAFGSESRYAAFRKLTTQDAERELDAIAKAHGAAYAWDFMRKAYLSDSGLDAIATDEHWMGHYAGQLLYADYHLDGLLKCDTSFTYGCIHGFMKAAIVEQGATIIPKIIALCDGAGIGEPCAHGAGSGLNSIERQDTAKAFADCLAIFKNGTAKDCIEGALIDKGHGLAWKDIEDDPWKFCAGVPAGFESMCAGALSDFLTASTDLTVPDKAGICAESPNRDALRKCFLILGEGVSREARGDLSRVLSGCALVPDRYRNMCYEGAADSIAASRFPDWSETTKALCGKVPGSEARVCKESS